VVFGTYRDLFAAIAAAAASLTGLLFVAISVAPRLAPGTRRNPIHQVRAAASLLAFTNALAVSLFGLVPRNNVGYPAFVLGIIGVLFTAAGLRSIVADPAARRRIRGQLGLIGLLLATFSIELVAGLLVIIKGSSTSALDVVSNVLVASLLIGVARAWELVGDRDTGIIASIAALAGHERPLSGYGVLDRPDGPAPGAVPGAVPGPVPGAVPGPAPGAASGPAGEPGGGGDRPDGVGERGGQDGSPPPAG
jgi:hypothetical protein